ncbi:pseudouridine-5'-phosphatase-like [Macrosteles quadrilineatus]|nr:pseudouridine-5'-phosphatase-like [Macrosteles quadrilineatus]
MLILDSCLNYAMGSYSPVTHVIFDLDGLILDTEKVYKLKYEELLARYNKQFTHEMRLAVLGRKDVDCAEEIIRATNIPLTPVEFSAEIKKLQTGAMKSAELKPGAERLVQHLARSKVPIAVATSSSRETYELKVSNRHELMAQFHHVVMAGSDQEVKKGKPHPDIYLVCASRFPDNPHPSKCLVLEDAHNGVQGAIAAGMQVVMVPEDFLPRELTKEATLVLNSLEEFQPEVFGLPKFS